MFLVLHTTEKISNVTEFLSLLATWLKGQFILLTVVIPWLFLESHHWVGVYGFEGVISTTMGWIAMNLWYRHPCPSQDPSTLRLETSSRQNLNLSITLVLTKYLQNDHGAHGRHYTAHHRVGIVIVSVLGC